jgi:hypothetical protein
LELRQTAAWARDFSSLDLRLRVPHALDDPALRLDAVVHEVGLLEPPAQS